MIRILTILAIAGFAFTDCVAHGQDAKTMKIKNLKILVPIYRGVKGSQDYIDDARLERIEKGCELGREFYFRNTFAKLNLELVFMPIDVAAPKNDGPTYDFFVEDLRKRGVKDNRYDGIFITGVGMTGNWGGFQVFGGTGAAFGGCGDGEPLGTYPGTEPDIAYDTGWTIVHEFQHALDLVICQNANHPEMLMDHPYADSMESYFKPGEHAGMHWDWVAHCLRSFTGYLDVGVRKEVWEVADAD